jgi:hypothetical protein
MHMAPATSTLSRPAHKLILYQISPVMIGTRVEDTSSQLQHMTDPACIVGIMQGVWMELKHVISNIPFLGDGD